MTSTILFTVNWLPFVFYLLLLARLIERLGTTDWGRLFVFATASFGTFVSGFLGSLNNHSVAAHGALFGLYHCLCIHLDDDRRPWRFLLAGLFAGWTICNELPAILLAAGLMLWLLSLSPATPFASPSRPCCFPLWPISSRNISRWARSFRPMPASRVPV